MAARRHRRATILYSPRPSLRRHRRAAILYSPRPSLRRHRRAAILYLNETWGPLHGGELRLYAPFAPKGKPPLCDVAPLADRLVLFHSELAHEVAVTRMPRISLTVWGFGHATRRAPPPSTLDLAPRCTSDHCQKAQRRREAEAFAAGLRIGAVKNIA